MAFFWCALLQKILTWNANFLKKEDLIDNPIYVRLFSNL